MFYRMPGWAVLLEGYLSLLSIFLILIKLWRASSTFQSVLTMDALMWGAWAAMIASAAVSNWARISIPPEAVSTQQGGERTMSAMRALRMCRGTAKLRRLVQHAADQGVRIESAAGLAEWRGVRRRPEDAVALVTDYATGQGLAWLTEAEHQELQILLGEEVVR